jgi:molybdopterin synthase catalytic subunit
VTLFRIVEEPIAPPMLDEIAGLRDGGTVTFLGIVREDSGDGRRVRALWYEACEMMALREFESIADEARHRFGGVRVAIIHRIGEVRAGEISVAVLAAAAHRAAAFDACRYAIDELKRRAPIWKKECYADGSAQWRSGA